MVARGAEGDMLAIGANIGYNSITGQIAGAFFYNASLAYLTTKYLMSEVRPERTRCLPRHARLSLGPDFVNKDGGAMTIDIEKNTREFLAAFEQLQAENRKDEYQEYLQSERWKILRKQILDFWGNRCILCYSSKNLHVHHRTYVRLGDEIFSDLIPLCDECHSKHHNVIPAYY